MMDMRSAAIYTAEVKELGDKEKHKGCLKLVLRNKEIMSHAIWAKPAFDVDAFWMPSVGDLVFVFFESGSWTDAFWFGHRFGQGSEPVEVLEGYPNVRMLQTVSGHSVIFDDNPGKERLVLRSAPKDGRQHVIVLDTAADEIFIEHGAKKTHMRIKPDGSFEILSDAVTWTAKDMMLNTGRVKWVAGDVVEIIDANQNKISMRDSSMEIRDKRGNVISLKDGVRVTDKSGCSVVLKGGTVRVDAKGKVYLNGGSRGVIRVGDRAVPHIHIVVAPPGGGPCTVSPATVSFVNGSTSVIAGG